MVLNMLRAKRTGVGYIRPSWRSKLDEAILWILGYISVDVMNILMLSPRERPSLNSFVRSSYPGPETQSAQMTRSLCHHRKNELRRYLGTIRLNINSPHPGITPLALQNALKAKARMVCFCSHLMCCGTERYQR